MWLWFRALKVLYHHQYPFLPSPRMTMGAPSLPLLPVYRLPKRVISANPNPNFPCRCSRGRTTRIRVRAIDGNADLPPAEVTWQIAVGALAGIAPFVVAGIEFGKRIVAQKKCDVCGGSGLVLRGDYYARCPGCGGFLPWQSWKRFFTG